MKIVKPGVELIWITPNAEQMIELAARTCYKSEDKITSDSSSALINKLVANGHHAMLEHASASLKFVCDRGVTHEFVRHRLCAYAQESTRYCNYGKDKFGNEITVIEPPGLDNVSQEAWAEACALSEEAYLEMLEHGCSPQIARSVLPTCLKTEIVCTANLREWRHIFTLRTSAAAHPQIKEVMAIALHIMQAECPTVFGDI
jgi:thymidylate synthase (FAD)